MTFGWFGMFGSLGAQQLLGGPSGPALEPLPQPSRIIAHWDASDTATLPVVANGTSIASWADKINGYPFTQATPANQPKYVANAEGGKPGVIGDGTSFMTMAVALAPLLQAAIASGRYTMVAVFKSVTARTTGTGSIFGSSTAGTAGAWLVADGTKVAAYFNSRAVTHDATNFTVFVATASGVDANNAPGATLSLGNRIYVNGTCANNVLADAPTVVDNFFSLLSARGTVSQAGKATLMELFFYDRELYNCDVLRLTKSLYQKYSVTLPWSAGPKFFLGTGASNTAGTGAGEPSTNSLIANLARNTLSLPYGRWSNLGRPSAGTASIQAWFNLDVADVATITGCEVVLVFGEYYNSAGNPTNAVALNRTYVASAVALPRFRTIMWTSLSTTNTAYEGVGKSREIFNNAFDANPPAGAYYVQTHLETHVGTQGAAAANPTLYADTVHLNSTGVPYHVATIAPALTTAWAA